METIIKIRSRLKSDRVRPLAEVVGRQVGRQRHVWCSIRRYPCRINREQSFRFLLKVDGAFTAKRICVGAVCGRLQQLGVDESEYRGFSLYFKKGQQGVRTVKRSTRRVGITRHLPRRGVARIINDESELLTSVTIDPIGRNQAHHVLSSVALKVRVLGIRKVVENIYSRDNQERLEVRSISW